MNAASQDRYGESDKNAFIRGRLRATRAAVPVPAREAPCSPRAQIVVLEEGSHAESILGRPEGLDQTAVIAQTHGETALQLAQRAIHRMASVQRSGADIAQVCLCLAPHIDGQTMAARRMLGAAVLAIANSVRPPCELVFVAQREDRELRRHLWQLVELLVTDPGSASVPIRLRFLDSATHAAC